MPQATSQQQVIQQQQARLADLEASAKQWEARCSDLRDMAAGHEARAREAASEVLKGNQIIERLQVRGGWRVGGGSRLEGGRWEEAGAVPGGCAMTSTPGASCMTASSAQQH